MAWSEIYNRVSEVGGEWGARLAIAALDFVVGVYSII